MKTKYLLSAVLLTSGFSFSAIATEKESEHPSIQMEKGSGQLQQQVINVQRNTPSSTPTKEEEKDLILEINKRCQEHLKKLAQTQSDLYISGRGHLGENEKTNKELDVLKKKTINSLEKDPSKTDVSLCDLIQQDLREKTIDGEDSLKLSNESKTANELSGIIMNQLQKTGGVKTAHSFTINHDEYTGFCIYEFRFNWANYKITDRYSSEVKDGNQLYLQGEEIFSFEIYDQVKTNKAKFKNAVLITTKRDFSPEEVILPYETYYQEKTKKGKFTNEVSNTTKGDFL